ncbi:MAG: TrmH family RNA methyltransferase [Bacteroidota bacterium]|nr:TrmH family RNA methyltransferase [Bacteroidota bacterium]
MRKLQNNELKRLSVEQFIHSKKQPIVVVLDNIRSALNVGAIFRLADCFLLEKIILCGITACPPDKNINKVALGSTESVKWEHESKIEDAVKKLKKKKYRIIAVEQVEKATYLDKYDNNQTPIALIFGNEVNGVSQNIINISDEVIEIPQFGTKHSLNISVSAGIVIWELWKKIKE